MKNDRDKEEVLNSSETRIQRGRKSASNSGLSGSRNLQSGPSLPRDASLHGRPSNPNSSSTDRGATSGHRLALQGDNKTGSISHSAPIGKAFKSIGTRLGSGRSGSTDGGSDNRRQPTNIATKSIYPSRPASALKSVSRRGLEGNSQSLSTPSRLRFMQQKSSSHPRSSLSSVSTTIPTPVLPARKSGSSNFPFRKQHAPAAPPPTPFRVKISRPFLPLWQQLDEEYERNNRRIRGDDFGGFAKRISSTTNRRGPVPDANLKSGGDDPRRLKGRIAPKLKLRLIGESQSSSSEEGDRRRQKVATKLPGRRVGGPQFAVKKSAARKVEYEDATTSEDSSEGDTDSQEDQLLPEEYDPPDSRRQQLSPNDIEMKGDDGHFSKFNPAPRITIPLPQVKTEPEGDPITRHYPPEELLNALETLTLTSIRIQTTRRLPFLRRNLRKGFFKRCKNLHLPIYGDHKTISLGVKYEYVDGIVFHAEIEDWLCPLCNFFGKFATRAMLNRHLEWDHREMFCDWESVEETDDHQSWKLQIMIPEEVRQVTRTSIPADQDVEKEDGEGGDEEEDQAGDEGRFGSSTVNKEEVHKAVSPPTTTFSSPFPSVSLSPPTSRQPHISTERDTAQSDSPSGPAKLEELSNLNPSISQQPRPYISPSIKSEIRSLALSRGRSTTGASLATVTPVRNTQRSAGDGQFPAPPPFDNPLGPAAQPPYLPAHSDYGGPTVYYSCRPGGACLFDLLGTLPMKQFGVLEWEVLDREEEIYENDDMKEEYKIMHALWARWILLYRNDFISNYLQGTISFVDDYWRMIHRASGWDGLRYWLLILGCNKCLTGHEVAQVLQHYEKLTGMASWYD